MFYYKAMNSKIETFPNKSPKIAPIFFKVKCQNSNFFFNNSRTINSIFKESFRRIEKKIESWNSLKCHFKFVRQTCLGNSSWISLENKIPWKIIRWQQARILSYDKNIFRWNFWKSKIKSRVFEMEKIWGSCDDIFT